MAEERAGRFLDSRSQIRFFIQQVLTTVLNRNSFYAAVGMTGILCDYTAAQTLQMYHNVVESRAKHKWESSRADARRTFRDDLISRFGDRVQVLPDGPGWTLNFRRPTPAEIEYVKRCLALFLPPLSAPPKPTKDNPFLTRVSPFLEESFAEMNRIYRFLHPDQFRDLAAQLSIGRRRGAFEDRVRVLDTAESKPTGPGSDSEDDHVPPLHMDRLNDLIEKYREQHTRLAPGSLCIKVDGIERATIDVEHSSCDAILERGANLVELVGRDDTDEAFTFATYVLTHDLPKRERWTVDIPGHGRMSVRFDYHEDESVWTSFGVLPNDEESAWANSVPESAGADSRDADLISTTIANAGATHDLSKCVLISGSGGSGKSTMIGWLTKRLVDSILNRLDYYRVLLSTSIHLSHDETQEKAKAEVVAVGRYAILHRRDSLDRAEEIDDLVTRQAQLFDEFLTKAHSHGLAPTSIPSIYEPHERLSRRFGALAIVSVASEGLAFYFLRDLLKYAGPSITGLTLMGSTVAAFLAAKVSRNFGWSLRLYRKYYRADFLIELLRSGVSTEAPPHP